jgi:restriction endonuclease S subunit
MNPERLLAQFDRISEAPDAIPKLRRFILDLAVRGKLVEQDPEDEPASELLSWIKGEKALLTAEGVLRKEKPRGEIDQGRTPFDLPVGWTWAHLGAITTIAQGFAFSSSYFTKNKLTGTPLIKIGDIGSDETESNTSEAPKQDCSVRSSDILLGLSGSIRCAIWRGIDSLLNQRIARIRPAIPEIPVAWLFLAVDSCIDTWKEETSKLTVQNIKSAQLDGALVALPPLAEQHRIVAKVDELMALCDQLEAARRQREQSLERLVAASLQRLNQPSEDPEAFRSDARFALQVLPSLTTTLAQIKQLRQTILNLAVRGKLVEQDPEDEPAEEQLERIIEAKILHGRKSRATKKKRSDATAEADSFQLPDGWATAPLADLVSVLNGRAYKQSELLDTGTPVLRVGNLFTSNKWYYSDLELEDDKYCNDGDLIFAWSASFGPFIWNGGRAIYHYHIWKLPLHSPTDLSRDYLYLYLLNKTAEIKAAGHGVSMIHMTKEKMEKLEVPLPPLAEQHRIVAKVDELLVLCDQLEQQLSQAEQQRRRLLEAVLREALGG